MDLAIASKPNEVRLHCGTVDYLERHNAWLRRSLGSTRLAPTEGRPGSLVYAETAGQLPRTIRSPMSGSDFTTHITYLPSPAAALLPYRLTALLTPCQI
jgi:hypothetical protein